MENLVRRLAATLHADVVGFTRAMADDDVATVRAVAALREEVHAIVSEHVGRVVDFVGDNFLAEFPSTLGALRCAIALQRALDTRPDSAATAVHRLACRIGVHMGDVVVEGARIYGDAVNVAARIQALAPTGGICVSAAVHDDVRRHVAESFDDLGARWLKNFPDPVRVFRMRLGTSNEAIERDSRERGGIPERKLTALMLCDGAGYGRMAARDEVSAAESLAGFQDLLPATVRHFRGRVVDIVGDGLFAEFPSATEAVACALEIQSSVAQRNRDVVDARRLLFRVGVHLDEVLVRGERLYGQAVHVVHHLAHIADPGGIVISEAVRERVAGKLPLHGDDLGEKTFDGMAGPLRAFRVKPPG